MTKQEYGKEIKRLIDTFGSNQFPSERVTLLYEAVKSLDAKWLTNTVNQMIGSMNHRVDIFELARSERSRLNALRLVDDISYAADRLREEISKEGFNDVLKKLDAKNLWDAVKKQKQKESGDEQ